MRIQVRFPDEQLLDMLHGNRQLSTRRVHSGFPVDHLSPGPGHYMNAVAKSGDENDMILHPGY